jgi:hypothetical protein
MAIATQPRLAAPNGVDDLEASNMRPHQERTAARPESAPDQLFAIHRDVEQIKPLLHQVHTVVNRGRKSQHVPKAICRSGFAP